MATETTIKKVAVAGATGNTGLIVTRTLAEHGFRVLALSRSAPSVKGKLSSDIEVAEVDYLSIDTMTSALKDCQALVVCGVEMLPEQINLIDAAIAAGVSRFFPADFAGDLSIPLHRTLHTNKNKVAAEEYLKKHESQISRTSIRTGPLTDFCLNLGILINMKEGSITMYDDGEKRVSTTTIQTAANAIVAALKKPEMSKNRAFRVQDFVFTQKQLLAYGKEIKPDVEWKVIPASIAEIAKKVRGILQEDPNSKMAGVMQRAVAVFGAEFTSDFGASDDAELGLKMMDEEHFKDLLRRFA